MPFEVFQTTAEHIVGATDAALQSLGGATEAMVAKFLDIPVPNASNALRMAAQLGLVVETNPGSFVACHPYAAYLVSGTPGAKAVILRFALEQYPPFKTFKQRLIVAGLAPSAAHQAGVLHAISAHRDVVLNTFIDLGTFTGSLASQGAGLYTVSMSDESKYLATLADVIEHRTQAELAVMHRLGREATDWVNREEVLEPLITGYQAAARVTNDSRAPIVYSGNAVESFLVQLGAYYGAVMTNATGINAKVDVLDRAHHITKKHAFMLKYLGHVRNAADHGTDVDTAVNHTWDISQTTAVEYVHVAQSVIAAVVAHMNGRFVV